ncbi:MAG: adenylate/guanylate cyclase domain-containing protein [Saprospiraceae bacterium]|nr:adenylate/guanylate cyclase domain-containing protein [Saprospiraceae bacterium]
MFLNLSLKGRTKRRVGQIIWITVFWTLAGALDALNTQALAVSQYMDPTEVYDFNSSFWVSVISAAVTAILSGAILLFYLRDLFLTKSFGAALVFNSIVISALNFLFSAIFYDLFLSAKLQVSPLASNVIQETQSILRSGFYGKNLIFWTLITFLTIVFLHVNDKYGPGVLGKLLTGRYHNPLEEERVFLFADINHSTAIAERLGHIRFFNLLNDFFRDITNSIIDTGGEIYQYVGDEIVISWPIKRGVNNANCIRCFYFMQEAIQKKAPKYLEKYGEVPYFKAGLHAGLVTSGEIGVIKKDIVYSGDVLNTTSRIINLCHQYDTRILLSKYLLDKLNLPPHDLAPERMGIFELKGKRQKVEIYTLTSEDIQKDHRPVITSI